MPGVRHSLSASDLGNATKREPGRFHQATEWNLLDLRQDVALEGAQVDELPVGSFPLGDLTLPA
jgi:hypothetical protein